MNYVLDASVALKWVLPEADSDKARRLRDESRNRVLFLLAPDFFPVEIAHALTRAERKKIIPVGYAKGFLADIMQTPPALHPHLPLLARATDISSETRLGVYDCVYVALAERTMRSRHSRSAPCECTAERLSFCHSAFRIYIGYGGLGQ
jgi:predicted nucleic acid-binding protein